MLTPLMQTHVQSTVMSLTPTHVLRELCRRYDAMEPTPSYQDLADHFKVTKGTVQYHAKALQREGYLRADGRLWPTIAGYTSIQQADALVKAKEQIAEARAQIDELDKQLKPSEAHLAAAFRTARGVQSDEVASDLT